MGMQNPIKTNLLLIIVLVFSKYRNGYVMGGDH